MFLKSYLLCLSAKMPGAGKCQERATQAWASCCVIGLRLRRCYSGCKPEALCSTKVFLEESSPSVEESGAQE